MNTIFTKGYIFDIIDNEFDDKYRYYGLFETTKEAMTFIRENRQVGNEITVLGILQLTVNIEELNRNHRDHF